jgi:hypothetical protein
MRVECERCHAIVAAELEVDPDGVTVSCPACGGTFRAEARRRAGAATAAPAGAAPGCVKCGAPVTDESACPRCGLARERAAAWAAAEPAPPPALVAAWAATEAAWTDGAVHDRAAAAALAHDALPWLARRYRDVQRARPDDAIARARIDRLGLMSVAALRATAAVPRPARAPVRIVYLVLAIAALTLAGVLLAARATASRPGEKRRPAIPGERLTRPRPSPGPRVPTPAPAALEPAAPGR